MKKKIFTTVLLSSILLSGAVTTLAAGEEREAKSDVNITLKKDTGNNENQEGTFVGTLAIVHYPSAYNFEGTASNKAINLENKNVNKNKQFISISDDRDNKGDWKLQGELSEITRLDADGFPATDAAARTTLPGALQIRKSAVNQYDIGNEKTSAGNYKPAAIDETTGAAVGVEFASETVNVVAGEPAVDILAASSAATGRGAYTNLGDATFAIDAGFGTNGELDGAVNYHGVITWTVGPTL